MSRPPACKLRIPLLYYQGFGVIAHKSTENEQYSSEKHDDWLNENSPNREEEPVNIAAFLVTSPQELDKPTESAACWFRRTGLIFN
ncbi:MAG TPA: hypothetical protein VGN42_22455 [Pirellulales bacterium]|jgi:hypothetical protein|nr:hypothetical protein [Pirellulales bacterium]